MKSKNIIELVGISKNFPGVKALNKVDLTVAKGEVHALLGENGAGKSTMMNIICGNYQPNEGEIIWNNKRIIFDTPYIAKKAGIGIVHQENSLLLYLDIKSNIFLGHYPQKFGFVDKKEIKESTVKLLSELGMDHLDPDSIVGRLSLADKQMVEIAKALSIKPKLLLLDEPTAALTKKETSILFDIILRLKNKDVGIIYISHRLEEVFEIADTVTILRDGIKIKSESIDKITMKEVITNMVGRELEYYEKTITAALSDTTINEVILKVENLTSKNKFEGINLELRKGEIVGIAGLVGAGRSELLESIFGYGASDNGEIYIKGKKAIIKHPKDAINLKIALIPEDRKIKGLFLERSVEDNICIASIKKFSKKLLLNKKEMGKVTSHYIEELKIKTPSVNKKVVDLSGGNQQKTIIARWLLSKPEILMLDEPTHGVDVGAKGEIYKIIEELKTQGLGIILVSSEMPELILLSDRIIVMRNGKISGELEKKEEINEENIMLLASGMHI